MSKYIFSWLLCFFALPAYAQYVLNYTDFKKSSDILKEADTYWQGKAAVLTPAEEGKRGGLWHAKKVKVRNGFSTSFSFKIHNTGISYLGEPQKGADGIAFVIHNNATATGMGGSGGGIGYEGIPNSLVVEFDNWRNDEWGEPNDNHVAIHTKGTSANTSAMTGAIAINSNLSVTLEDGQIHKAKIEYEKGVLKVYLDGKEILSKAVDIGKTLNLDNEMTWVGFTASTGAAYANQEIHHWEFKGNLSPPAVKEPEPDKPVIVGDRPVITGKKVIKVHSPKITLQVWDKGIEDGDIISLNFNNQWILENYSLKRNKKSVEVTLSEEHNLLVLHALNLGKIPPNTVILTVVDGKKTHQTLLNSNLKASDSVEILYKPK
jgi:hypothetical protein